MAKKLFPDGDALGQRIREPIHGPTVPRVKWRSSASSLRTGTKFWTAISRGRLFVPLAQGYSGGVYLHVRTDVDQLAPRSPA